MPSSLIVAALGLEATGFAAAAVTLAVRVVTTMALASILARDANANSSNYGNTGGQVQLPPNTSNKLPVVYGDAWVSPVVIDAKISTDQQTMWYVLAFSEATSGTVNFGEVYFDDKLLIFDPDNPSEIRGWYVPSDNTTVTGVAGDISMWFYNNGSESLNTTHHCLSAGNEPSEQPTTISAIQVLQDAGIPANQQWGANHLMSNTVFAIMRIKYDSNHNVTGLGQIKAKVSNSLTSPGEVLYDYLTNSRYGCAVDAANIDQDSLTELDIYSQQSHSIVNISGGQDSGVRYTTNGIIDTNNDCLSNLITIADNADSWIQWNETQGKWGVTINRSIAESGYTTATITSITSNQIIGGIQITPLDLNSTYNSLKVQFPNAFFVDPNTGIPVADRFLGQTDYRYFSLDPTQRFANEPNNELSVNLPLTNNSFQATYIGYKRLFTSREDLNINFTMDYSGIQIDAGDVVKISHEWYGWNQKQFRVTQIREMKSEDGFLSVQISAVSYDDKIFTVTDPHFFTPAKFNNISDPGYISKPDAPSIPPNYVGTDTATFVVQGNVPAQGNVVGMEFWYSTKGAELANNNYVLYDTQYYAHTVANVKNISIYPHKNLDGSNYYEQIMTMALPIGTYYWRTRAQGVDTASEFSEASSAFNWTVVGKALSGTQINDNSISGSKVISGDPATTGGSQSNGFFDTLGKVALAGLGLAGVYYGYKNGVFDSIIPKDWQYQGGGNDQGETVEPKSFNIYPRYPDSADANNPAEGDTVEYVADATPDPGDLGDYTNFAGYDVPPFDFGGGDISLADFSEGATDTGPVVVIT